MPVSVLGANRMPLTPCHPAVARKLLATGKAAVLRRFPLTIILKRAVADPKPRPLRLKIDPGSRITGIALVDDATGAISFAAEIEHRGLKIKAALTDRRARRKCRRQRKTRYRKARFLNRNRPAGWLPPSLESRVANVLTWVARLRRLASVGALGLELVKFDTQAMQNPEVSGVAYQQGELAGYEVREYLLEKWRRRCAYCDVENVPLQVEHIDSTSRGGSNRVSNLCLACEPCNRRKGNQPVAVFLAKQPERLKMLLAQAKAPLKDAAAVNATRWALFRRVKASGLPLETGTGARTKFNRKERALPKAHWLDAACVGASTPPALHVSGIRVLAIKAMGWGLRQRCRTDRFGFPKAHVARRKAFLGFQTGDIVRACIPKGKHAGEHLGRVTIRQRPSFQLRGFDVHPKYLTRLQRADGYDYTSTDAFKSEP